MWTFSLSKIACIVSLFCAKATISSPAQTFTTLATFYGLNGNFPAASFLQGTDGNFYGTTYSGGNYIFCGSYYCGTVFKVTAQGTLTSLHSFEGTDGLQSLDALVQATDGNFYGTTKIGGNNSGGTVFKITVQGTLTKLSNFCSLSGCADGLEPVAGLARIIREYAASGGWRREVAVKMLVAL